MRKHPLLPCMYYTTFLSKSQVFLYKFQMNLCPNVCRAKYTKLVDTLNLFFKRIFKRKGLEK